MLHKVISFIKFFFDELIKEKKMPYIVYIRKNYFLKN